MVGIRYPRRYRVDKGNAIKVPLHMQTHALTGRTKSIISRLSESG